MNNNAEQDNHEEILLYNAHSSDVFDATDENASISVKFTQSDRERLQGKNLIIFDNQHLSVSDFQYKKKRHYWIDLTYVNPQPRKQWLIRWGWFWAAIGFTLLAALCGFTPVLQVLFGATGYDLSILIIFATGAVLCGLALIRQSMCCVWFDSLHGVVPILQLMCNNPDPESFHAFIDVLIEKIHLAQNRPVQTHHQRLAAELTEHRRLMEKGVLSMDLYQQAKLRLFSLHGP